jgi:hypothetical protein
MTEIPERADIPGEVQPDESNFVVAARKEVNKLISANRVNRRVILALCIVSVLVVAACGVLTWVAVDQHSSDQALRQSGITSCQAGNSFRSEQTEIWQDFIGLLITRDTPPKALAIAHNFLTYVGKVDALRNCSELYGTAAGSP